MSDLTAGTERRISKGMGILPRGSEPRSMLAVLSLSTLLIFGTACSEPARNVVLITIDTLRADHVGAYGGPVPTPAMDQLAAKGVLVVGACTPTPSTGPAHMSLLTGLHPWRHGVLRNAVPLDAPDRPILAEVLLEAGFRTAAFVSSYNVDQRWGFGRGFETFHFRPTDPYKIRGERVTFWNRGETTTDAALSWLEAHSRERFFLWLHYFDPHRPYLPPTGYRRPETEPVDLKGKRLPPEVPSLDELTAQIRAYRGEVAYTDAQVGRVLEALGRLGLLHETALIVTADHGEGLGDHGHLSHERNLHDELVTVPLILRAPDLPAGRQLGGAVQLEDLMPTILAFAGVAAPAGLDGLDLLPWMRGDRADSPRAAVIGRRATLSNEPALFFERRWPRKWIGELDGSGRSYRLDQDPQELYSTESPRVPDHLRARISGAVTEGRDQVPDDETRRALEALGYL